jgi:hypothetical protein
MNRFSNIPDAVAGSRSVGPAPCVPYRGAAVQGKLASLGAARPWTAAPRYGVRPIWVEPLASTHWSISINVFIPSMESIDICLLDDRIIEMDENVNTLTSRPGKFSLDKSLSDVI